MKSTTKNTNTTTTRNIPLDAISVPAWNARHADDELVASVSIHGLLAPIAVVQDGTDHYRLVFGARRLDAAKKAGLSAIPATVHDQLDEGAQRVLCIVENAQRAEADPIQQGRLFRELVSLGLGVGEIARRVSKRPEFVRQRIRLAALSAPILQSLTEVPFSPAAAALLAALPVAEQGHIVEALPHLLTSAEDLRDHIERTSPKLASAPFDISDATLSPAPACATCKKRLDSSAGDACLDKACFARKANAALCNALVGLRTGDHKNAPVVATAEPSDDWMQEIFKARAVSVLRDERVAGDDEPGGRPAIIIDDCRPRLVRLLPADRKPDGRASRYAAPDQRLDQQRTAFVARAVAALLDKHLAAPPHDISSEDAPTFLLALASALLGSDFDNLSDAALALLRALAPRLRERLSVRTIATVQPEPLRANALRVLRLVASNPDADLSDLDAKAVQAFPG